MKKNDDIQNVKKTLGLKRIFTYVCSFAILCCLPACGGGGDDDNGGGGGGSTSSMSATMAAEGTSVLVTVDALDSPITSAVAQDNWLTVEVTPYSAGAPMVKLTATSNPNTKERKTVVVIKDTSENTVRLTVNQKGKADEKEGTGIDDAHNSVTDQPAYAPARGFE